MTELKLPITSRRQLLKYFASVPMLPMGAMAASSLLTGCNDSNDDNNNTTPTPIAAKFKSAVFSPMAAPNLANPAEMATMAVNSSLVVTLDDNSTKAYALAYQPFFVTGDLVSDGMGGKMLAGGYFDINNQPILDTSVAGSTRYLYSDCPDGSSLLTLDNPTVSVTGKPVFAVVQFEYTSENQAGQSLYGQLPSPIAVLTLDQDQTTGQLSLVKYHNVDTSGVNGLWITCGASLSPWNTHLSSEEYEPDATKAATDAQLRAFSTNLYGKADTANPYHYGHLPEVTVNPDGTGSIKKHYCLGRISHELVQVMPDERTVLMGDDYTNGGLFVFVADTAKDLSAGTLYVAKWTQTSGVSAGAGTLTWIKLGHATSTEIKAMADTLTAADIMDVKTVDPIIADPTATGYTQIAYSGGSNWVKLMPGMEKAAAFLETHRYAALVGGSLEFTKMEGTTVNAKDKVAYSAMSYVYKSMTDGKGDIHVEGPNAGAVYALNLTGGQNDLTGTAINSEWMPVDMAAVPALIGEDLATADSLGNTANPNKIANPDNIKFSETLRTLFVGEDSGMHVNNFLWAYNVDTKVLSRVMSTPAGAESTGLHAVDEINGWTYVMSNFQHAGDWGGIHANVKETLEPLINLNYKNGSGAAVGYLTASPKAIALQA